MSVAKRSEWPVTCLSMSNDGGGLFLVYSVEIWSLWRDWYISYSCKEVVEWRSGHNMGFVYCESGCGYEIARVVTFSTLAYCLGCRLLSSILFKQVDHRRRRLHTMY